MIRLNSDLTAFVRRLAAASLPLTAFGLVMIGGLALSLAGLWLDPRTISGAPAWMKPVKFAGSTAVYALTMAWAFTYLPDWTRMRRIVGGLTTAVLAGEIAIIDLQAWRGTTSHFNVATPLDAVLFSVMGIGIVVQTLTSVAFAVALWRQTFADRALGWALRLGVSITIVGAFIGGMMTRPTDAQIASMRETHRMPIAGAHTVGGPDGVPGMPVTGWSQDHGDLRVPHFVGLHAFQALPALAILLRRRRLGTASASRTIAVAAAAYVGLFVLLLAQAMNGQSVLAPDASTITVLGVWAIATAAGVALAMYPPPWRSTRLAAAHDVTTMTRRTR